ncbi:hypothetical protein L218DRAFT_398980 [Marasmius fiardii PR-910]|nr:hypothetical protein L218DRAFT_398980 [Marasmius fiardii PR-910]
MGWNTFPVVGAATWLDWVVAAVKTDWTGGVGVPDAEDRAEAFALTGVGTPHVRYNGILLPSCESIKTKRVVARFRLDGEVPSVFSEKVCIDGQSGNYTAGSGVKDGEPASTRAVRVVVEELGNTRVTCGDGERVQWFAFQQLIGRYETAVDVERSDREVDLALSKVADKDGLGRLPVVVGDVAKPVGDSHVGEWQIRRERGGHQYQP